MRCVDCGTPCADHRSYRCISCASRERNTYLDAVGRRGSGWFSPEARARRSAASTAHAQAALAERIEIIEEYLACGVEPDRIAADFGIQQESLWRQLHRWGRHDLAARFDHRKPREHYYTAGKTCITCGTPITNKARRCQPCASHLDNQSRRRDAA